MSEIIATPNIALSADAKAPAAGDQQSLCALKTYCRPKEEDSLWVL